MKDLSICIAHRGDPLGLWATVTSCCDQLSTTNLDYEFCICVNGESHTPRTSKGAAILNLDTARVLEHLDRAGKLGYVKILQRDLAPPTARQFASERASGKHLFFFDNHILLAPNYFNRALSAFSTGADMVHSATNFYPGQAIHYHYSLKPHTSFWAESVFEPVRHKSPYAIAAAGHGGFAVTADSWQEVGGYWKGFAGYAGEELTTDLQYWMRGKTVYMAPQMIHYHWAGKRSYSRHFTDDYYRNLMMSAHIIGGEKYLWSTYECFAKSTKRMSPKSMYDLLEEAYYGSRDEARRLAACRTMDLDTLLDTFKQQRIAH